MFDGIQFYLYIVSILPQLLVLDTLNALGVSAYFRIHSLRLIAFVLHGMRWPNHSPSSLVRLTTRQTKVTVLYPLGHLSLVSLYLPA